MEISIKRICKFVSAPNAFVSTAACSKYVAKHDDV